MILSIIAAYDENRGIGFKNTLPWNYPEDLKHFKSLTLNKTIVMGRNTFDSLPGMLPKRKHIVLSRDVEYKNRIQEKYPEVLVLSSLEEFFEYAKKEGQEEYCIIGGGVMWTKFLPYIDIMHLTHIKKAYEVDTYFPEFDVNEWDIVNIEDFKDFSFVDYKRK